MILTFQEFISKVYRDGLKDMIPGFPRRGKLGTFGSTTMFTFYLDENRFTITLCRNSEDIGQAKRIIYHAMMDETETTFCIEQNQVSNEEAIEMINEIISHWPTSLDKDYQAKRNQIFEEAANIDLCWAGKK